MHTTSVPSPTPAPEQRQAAARPIEVPRTPPFQLSFDKPDVRLSASALTWRGPSTSTRRPDGNTFIADLKPALDAYRAGQYRASFDALFVTLRTRYPASVEAAFYQGATRLLRGDATGAIEPLTAAEAAPRSRICLREHMAARGCRAARRTGRRGTGASPYRVRRCRSANEPRVHRARSARRGGHAGGWAIMRNDGLARPEPSAWRFPVSISQDRASDLAGGDAGARCVLGQETAAAAVTDPTGLDAQLAAADALFTKRRHDEARAAFEQVLAIATTSALDAQRARALLGLGNVSYYKNEKPPAPQRAPAKTLALYERLGDKSGIGRATHLLSLIEEDRRPQ